MFLKQLIIYIYINFNSYVYQYKLVLLKAINGHNYDLFIQLFKEYVQYSLKIVLI